MSFRYPAGLITAGSPVVPQYPTGVWTNQQAAPYIQNNVWGVDPEFDQTVLLLHGDGTNGAQNNTFLDSSTNNFTITRNGNTTQGSFSPFSKPDGRWGNYFDGSGDYLTLPANTAFVLGSGDFIVEAFSYVTGGDNQIIYDFRDGASDNAFNFGRSNSDGFYLFNNTAGTFLSSGSGTAAINTWNHVVVSRVGSTIRMFVNGTQVASVTKSTDFSSTAAPVIGGSSRTPGSDVYTGYISNLRVVKGSGVTSVTVPTSPLTAISGTSVLTCQSNRFIDNSTNNFTITVNGDVRVTPFSPFPTLTAYDAATNGGSGYFDGSGDYLTVADNAALDFGTGDFTIQFWAWFAATPTGDVVLLEKRPSLSAVPWIITADATNGGTVYFYDGTVRRSSIAITPRAWQHYAFTRSSGTLKIFVNGVEGFSGSVTTNLDSTGQLVIAARADFGVPFTGYMSGLQLLKGTGYTSFSVPTAPPTAITNTSLLCNFTNAGILDNTMSNNLETVGNAQIDTTTKKYGTGSMEFDGSGDSLIISDTKVVRDNFAFGTGDFTVEMWVYPTANPATYGAIPNVWSGSDGWGFQYMPSSAATPSTMRWDTFVKSYSAASNAVPLNQWTHVAVTRAGGTFRFWVNGVQSGSTQTDTENYNMTAATFNLGNSSGGSREFIGYIDDLRITKGVARYTSNFTPPIARFPNQ